MSNQIKQTAVQQFSNKAYELFEQYSEGKFDRITLNKLMLEATEQAKKMEKRQIKNAHNEGYGSGYMDDLKSPEQYYNETYEGNK